MRFLRACATLAVAAGATCAAAAELTPEDFAYGRIIATPEQAAVYRLAMPAEVYGRTVREDLGDLRIFNARGEVVPYTVKRPPGETRRAALVSVPLFPLKGDPVAALEAMRITIESGKAAVSLRTQTTAPVPAATMSYIMDARALRKPLAALQLDWPEDAAEFAGRLRVEASDELAGWRVLADAAPVANLHADGARLVERRVEFPATQAKFWRLSWAGAVPSFAITAVQVEPAAGRVELPRDEIASAGKPIADHPGELEFDLGAGYPVDRLNFELPERNSIVDIDVHSRDDPSLAWQPVIRHGFYRLETRNGEMRSGPVSIAPNSSRYWRIKLGQQGAGLGSVAPRLQAGWIPDEIVFVARGEGPFQLAYGSAVALPSAGGLGGIPQDIAVVRATAGAQRLLGGEARLQAPPPPLPWKSWILWAVLGLGVALLAWMAYRLSKQL